MPPTPPPETPQQEPLLAELRALEGGLLQKLWLLHPTQLVLALRGPGRTAFVLVDSQRALAGVLGERPAAPESALKSQATLRAALLGARFDLAQWVAPRDAGERARAALQLHFTTHQGARVLLADPRAHALALARREEEQASSGALRIIWTAPGAATTHRPGALLEPGRVAESGATSKLGDARRPAQTASADPAAPHTAGEALAAHTAQGFAREKQLLLRSLRSRADKLGRARVAVERDLERAQGAAAQRQQATLLLPYQSRIPRGAREAQVPDWSQLDEQGAPRLITIALDPALDAAANASRLLRRAQRYSAALPQIAARLGELQQREERVRSLLARAELAADAAALRLATAESEAEPSDAAQAPRGPAAKAAAPRLPYRAFRASNGARILVGRSAKDNDALTLRHARGNDLWLHARGVQGSHVLLLEPGDAPDARALAEAALLALHFSSARGADGAEVSWTRRKHVRKGKGQAAGAVTFSQEKSIRVRLDDALLAALLGREER